MRPARALALVLLSALVAACDDPPFPRTAPRSVPAGPSVDDVMGTLPRSCAFDCGAVCDEPTTPFACPTLAPWSALPHADSCGAWDGSYPAPTQGKCTSSDATAAAARKAGEIPGGFVLPDGRAILPAGREVLFAESDLSGGFPMSLMRVPGTRWVAVSDGGIQDNALRIVDVDALASGGEPVKSYVRFQSPSALYYGLAFVPPARLYASGGGDGRVYAFDLDLPTGAVTRAPDADLTLSAPGQDSYYAGPIAVTAAGDRLLVGPSERATSVQIYSLAAADYGAVLASVDLGKSHAIYDLRVDPFDPAGALAYATDQTGSRLLEIDASTGTLTRTLELQRNPSQLVFLDGKYMVVAEANSDALALVDRSAMSVAARVHVLDPEAPPGFSPSALAWDPAAGRLYAVLAGVNAVEAYDVAPGDPPTVTPVGRIPTAWWPSGVTVDDDGSLVIVNGKGHGTGTDKAQYTWAEGTITSLMRGSVQHVPAAELADLAAHTATVEATRHLATAEGAPVVTCPAGAEYDFPIPRDNTSGPSRLIDHVIFIVRENKTYDAIFGDRADLGDGDPSLVMAPTQALQDAVWQNARAVAGQFTNFDNYYTDAEQSLQGHIWTVYGRTTDYFERIWLTTWGRGTRPITSASTAAESVPEEHGAFVWLSEAGVSNVNMGEPIDPGPEGLDGDYPGLVYAQNVPDIDKSCYMVGRIRVACDLPSFTYATQTNDHTYGAKADAAAPEVYIAVNDEALGILLDGLSHSPLWKSSLVIVTEDDPQDGGDHVDMHRSILLMASPWVKRGYVSHGHYDVASIHKLVAHVFGVPYHNEMAEAALLPLDAFTSTPDYTPYDYLPRTVAAPCNGADSKEAKRAEGWDFEELDDQPGLSEQIARMMKDSPAERGVRLVKRPGAR